MSPLFVGIMLVASVGAATSVISNCQRDEYSLNGSCIRLCSHCKGTCDLRKSKQCKCVKGYYHFYNPQIKKSYCRAQEDGVSHCSMKPCEKLGGTCVNFHDGFKCICGASCECLTGYYRNESTNTCDAQTKCAKHCTTHGRECDPSFTCKNVQEGIKCVCKYGKPFHVKGRIICAISINTTCNKEAYYDVSTKLCISLCSYCEGSCFPYARSFSSCNCVPRYYYHEDRTLRTGYCLAQDPGVSSCTHNYDHCASRGGKCVNVKNGIKCYCDWKCECLLGYYKNELTRACEAQTKNAKNCATHGAECDPRSSICKNLRDDITCVCKYGRLYRFKDTTICSCDYGYYYKSATKKCEAQNDDVQHCLTDKCLNGEKCKNVIDGIRCDCAKGQINNKHGQCQCLVNTYWNGLSCDAQKPGVAHCSTRNTCDEVAERCENVADGIKCICIYAERDGQCMCPKGYYPNNKTDKCDVQDNGAKHCFVDDTCDELLEVCVNTKEGIQCNCKDGLKRVKVKTGEWKCEQLRNVSHCDAFNPCNPKTEVCKNSERGPRCKCKFNYELVYVQNYICVPRCHKCVKCVRYGVNGKYQCVRCAKGYALRSRRKMCQRQ